MVYRAAAVASVEMVLRVDSDRMRADFDALATFGATPDGGVERTTFSEAHVAAAGLVPRQSPGRGTRAPRRSGRESLCRSAGPRPGRAHALAWLTSRFGQQGWPVRRGIWVVICALEVVRAVRDADLDLPVALEAIDFTDEEGTLIGTLGSCALAGQLSAELLAAPRGGRELLVTELERMRLHRGRGASGAP